MPVTLDLTKSDKAGEQHLELAKKFRDAELLSDAELADVERYFRPAGMEKYKLSEPWSSPLANA